MKSSLGLINTSLAVILGIGCVACVEQPATPSSATGVLAVRREMLSAERPAGAAAGPGLALGAVGAVVASSSGQEIPGCEQVLEADVSARSGRFTASASLSCQTVNEYSYLDIAAYVTDAARSEVTVLTSAVVEDFNVDAVQTIEITGAVEPGQILFFDSLALTSNLDDLRIGYLQLEPSP